MEVNWNAVEAIAKAIAACAGAAVAVITPVVAVLVHIRNNKRAATQATSATSPTAPVPEVPAPLRAPPPKGTTVLDGFSPDRKSPRQLDLVVKGGDLSLFMHPPDNLTAGRYMTASIDEIRERGDAGERTLAQTGAKRFKLKWPADNGKVSTKADPNVLPGEIRIQLGTPSDEWWMYAKQNDFHEKMRAVGLAAHDGGPNGVR